MDRRRRQCVVLRRDSRLGGGLMSNCRCEYCDEEAYGMIDGLVAICWDCDTSCGSFEPSVEVN